MEFQVEHGGVSDAGQRPKLEVGPSWIAGAGLGLFATAAIAQGETITEYTGNVLRTQEALR
jgi:SET domain-containing protein